MKALFCNFGVVNVEGWSCGGGAQLDNWGYIIGCE